MNPLSDITLRSACDARGDLTRAEVAEMRGLLDRYFEGVDEVQFATDLLEKTHVLRVWKGEELVGFSTLRAYRAVVAGEPFNILYSGDTIMSPECWGSPALARGWIAMVRDIHTSMPAGRCLWLLLSAGFRTYRFLPVFWRGFWPRYDGETPDDVRALRDAIARERFGDRYDPVAGVVRFALPHRLNGELAAVPAGRGNDPHVAYFFRQNPGWRDGDELVCLTEIDDGNLTPAGRRMIRGLRP
jgi:hypothetical protein